MFRTASTKRADDIVYPYVPINWDNSMGKRLCYVLIFLPMVVYWSFCYHHLENNVVVKQKKNQQTILQDKLDNVLIR